MTPNPPFQEAGGFFQPVIQVVSNSPIKNALNGTSILPTQRSGPLKPGGSKESGFIDYVDQKLLGISRRYEKRFNAALKTESAPDVEGKGYERFKDVAKDLDALVDVVWVSGTPSLQIPYFLTIALAVSSYLPSFSFSPRPTFELLHKLDLAFSSLLQGMNVETGDSLSGFGGGRGKLSTTEKVRMRGLVERTRLVVVEVAGGEGSVNDVTSTEEFQEETSDELMTDDTNATIRKQINEEHGRWEMEVARVYEKTIVELGASLDASSSGGFGGFQQYRRETGFKI